MNATRPSARGQANLAVLGIALLALTTVTGLGITLADGALASADREPLQRHAADALADRLVSPDASTTHRANVLNLTVMNALTPADIEDLSPSITGYAYAILLADRTIVEQGNPAGGVTVRRIVLVATESTVTESVDLATTESVSLPRRTERIRLSIRPVPGTQVTTVRANDRIVLYDPNGLDGTTTIRVSRYDTVRLEFETQQPAARGPDGAVTITYYPRQTTKAILAVSVDA